MIAFAEHHDQWRLLAHRPELTEQAVEEVMRLSRRLPPSADSSLKISNTTAYT
jgi:cytochrome P450